MARIKIQDLPEKVQLSGEEARKYFGGAMSPRGTMLPIASFGSGAGTVEFENTKTTNQKIGGGTDDDFTGDSSKD